MLSSEPEAGYLSSELETGRTAELQWFKERMRNMLAKYRFVAFR